MNKADITIIGAGVVGLAIAARLEGARREVYLVEKNEIFGLETSSRHSGVIHAGIYYPPGSLKAKMCLAGNRTLYELCERYGIGYRRTGKLIVATSDDEVDQLQMLFRRGQQNGVADLKMISGRELKELEPNVAGVAAILSPSTGIIDSHMLMRYFMTRAQRREVGIAFQTRVIGIDKIDAGYQVTVEDSSGQNSFTTRVLVNCSGLYCDQVAALAGIDVAQAGYRLHYCKGEYFSLMGSGQGKLVERLVYPLPPPKGTGVGIHVTFDLDGRIRLGPGIQYVDHLDYSVDSEHQQLFYDSVSRFLPAIEYDDLVPEMAGIRPKLQEPGGEIRDFVIREESDRGLPGLINLIGIESPGLTASPAIAEYVTGLIEELLQN
jgi:L-2-hydroxyglutarate oxidase LhgO